MLARRQELNTQLQQIFDSFLLGLSLFGAHVLRYHSTEWFDLEKTIDPLANYRGRVGALVALIILAVPMLIVALLIKFTSKGPPIFQQQRAG